MAEVKNAFIKSKMNKDLDSRLLPRGEYRDGQNIQVSKSEGEDVGALENVIGNLPATTSDGTNIDFSVLSGCGCSLKSIGVHADTSSSTLFIFLTDYIEPTAGITYSATANNYIYSYNTLTSDVSIVAKGAFLNFSQTNPIIGINLLENLLFWTDNRNQPRKLNVDVANNGNYYVSEDLISVSKYNPYEVINLYYQDNSATTPSGSANPNQGQFVTSLQDVTSPLLPDGTTDNMYYNSSWSGDPDYLEDKFVTCSYRFQFNDGEYSILAPFTQEAFIPKQDGYFLQGDEDAAYRSTIVKFMENKVNSVGLYIPLPFAANALNSSLDISNIDIIYKESDSLTIKVLEKIPFNTFRFNADGTENTTKVYYYDYQSRKPYKTLPEKETVRVYDKVPVRAFGQEVSGNRIIYSNFQDKHTPPETINYDVAVTNKSPFVSTGNYAGISTSIIEYPQHTVKQNRNYQVGFILSDRYGRQSTTILSPVNTKIKTDSSGVEYGGSTFYHPYLSDPGTGNNITKSWQGDSLKILVNAPGISTDEARVLDGWPGLWNGDPTSSSYNPLGWYSYKIVVKQTEQEYYNVYLPGIIGFYPNVPATPPDAANTVAFVTLIGDNVNKIPADTTEITQIPDQFTSKVNLFGRVTPKNVAQPALLTGNIPYYPVLNKVPIDDVVSTISKQNVLFDNILDGQGVVSFGSIYQTLTNPLLARVTQNGATIGSSVTASSTTVQNILLGVYETAPVESLLDIFWETSSVGLISDLNTLANENTAGGSGVVADFDGFTGSGASGQSGFIQTEGFVAGQNAVTGFAPTTVSGFGTAIMQNSTVQLLKVYDGLGEDISSRWGQPIKVQVTGQPDRYNLPIVTPSYFSTSVLRNTFWFIFNVRNDDPSITNPYFQEKSVSNVKLLNVDPTIDTVTPLPILAPEGRVLDDSIATFTGVNGFVGTATQNKQDLIWSISNQSPAIPVLQLNSETGVLKETTGTATGLYLFDLVLTDSGGTIDQTITPVSVIFGQIPAETTFGAVSNETPAILSNGLESVGVYWGAANSSASLITGTPLPYGMSNGSGSPVETRSFTAASNLDPTFLDGNNNEQITTPWNVTTDRDGAQWDFKNSNYRPDFFDTNAGTSGHTLSKGTGFIKLDLSFTMWDYDETWVDYGGAYPGTNEQLGVLAVTYLQYRANSNANWETATDVEGKPIRFGGTQRNIGGTGAGGAREKILANPEGLGPEQTIFVPSSFSSTGVLANPTVSESQNGNGGLSGNYQPEDVMEATTVYPQPNGQPITTSVLSKVFVFGKDENYGGGNTKLGEYRLLSKYPQTSTDQIRAKAQVVPGVTSFSEPSIFSKNGAQLVNSNIELKLSFGDFYYATDIASQSFPYEITKFGKLSRFYSSNDGDPNPWRPGVVYAREWAFGYVSQFYTDATLTNKWQPENWDASSNYYSYRGTSSTNYNVVHGTNNASVVRPYDGPGGAAVANATNLRGSQDQRFWTARFDATGKKVAQTAQPAWSEVNNA